MDINLKYDMNLVTLELHPIGVCGLEAVGYIDGTQRY